MADTAKSSGAMLQVDNLHAWYGESHILHGVAFDVREGEEFPNPDVTDSEDAGAFRVVALESLVRIDPRGVP